MIRPVGPAILLGVALLLATLPGAATPSPLVRPTGPAVATTSGPVNSTAIGNFSQALNRIVTLIGAAGGAILAIAWSRVALSWFSNDVAKKVQAKDRARDALVGSLIFAAALSGLLWGLATWVLGGG